MNGPSDFHDWAFETLSARDYDDCEKHDSRKDDDDDEPDDEPFKPDYLDYDFPSNYRGKPL